jgi:hypothetical protein
MSKITDDERNAFYQYAPDPSTSIADPRVPIVRRKSQIIDVEAQQQQAERGPLCTVKELRVATVDHSSRAPARRRALRRVVRRHAPRRPRDLPLGAPMQSAPHAQPSTLNAKHRWYYEAFWILSQHLRRAPSTREFARYVKRNEATVHRVLTRLVAEGVLFKSERGQFVFVAPKAAK